MGEYMEENKDLQVNAPEPKVEEPKEPSYNDYRKELSKELGINMFDTNGMKQLKGILAEHKDFKDSQKTELEKLTDTVKGFETTKKEWSDKELGYQSTIAALKLDIADDKLSDALNIAKSKLSDKVDINEALKQTVEQYPIFKKSNDGKKQANVEIGSVGNKSSHDQGTGDPLYDAWLKKRANRNKIRK